MSIRTTALLLALLTTACHPNGASDKPKPKAAENAVPQSVSDVVVHAGGLGAFFPDSLMTEEDGTQHAALRPEVMQAHFEHAKNGNGFLQKTFGQMALGLEAPECVGAR